MYKRYEMNTIGYIIETPLQHLHTYAYKYRKTDEPEDKKLWESFFMVILKTLTVSLENLDISSYTKKDAINSLKEINLALEMLENEWGVPDQENSAFSLDLQKSMYAFYDALENLSIALSVHTDEDAKEALEKLQKGDYSDFSVYKIGE